ncbi:ankyrin repeat domain-containing protein [Cellulomonas sp. 179-A 4D5 NHS]|uniref:ankyrin repeat domain-containing protein n=1 Tax=Cellulomonas sp. 179-A 4D5 NHS TaxID=3142378 RepID=UPI00399F1AE5
MDATLTLAVDDPLAREAADAIRTGDVERLRGLLDANPGLAAARITRDDAQPDATVEDLPTCTLLHVATDHPGHLLAVGRTIEVLVAAGADPDAPFTGPHAETALHWAASNDDVEAVEALVRAGADLEAPGAVIGDGSGTPLADAVAFGQWRAAEHLFHAGATPNLWQAAGLGIADRVEALLDAEPAPDVDDLTTALWCAAHGGQRACVDLLLARGADPTWIGFDGLTAAGAARRAGHGELADALTP